MPRKFSKEHIRQLQAKARKVALSIKSESLSTNQVAKNIRTASDGFNFAPEWKDLSEKVLARYGWTCMKCGSLPRCRKYVNVDHIKPRKFFPELALEFENLQVLCSRCNKQKANGPAVDCRKKA